jgi:hypothetical protein
VGKKLRKLKPIIYIQKHSYPKICGILKLKKLIELSKIDPKFYNFESPL